MGILSKEEKEEFLNSSHCLRLEKDFNHMRNNRFLYLSKDSKVNLDKYIKFLSLSNSFINHRKKPFRKIEGNHFKLWHQAKKPKQIGNHLKTL